MCLTDCYDRSNSRAVFNNEIVKFELSCVLGSRNFSTS